MIKSFERMFAILAMFSMESPSLSISEIEKELQYPKSTIFRILNTLIKADFIIQDPDTHRYSIGKQFFRLGSIFQSKLDLRNIALPIMKQLSERTSETIELNIVDEINRLCIEKVDSTLAVRNFVRIGDRHPLHLGASGKALIAFLEREEQEFILQGLQKDFNIDVQEIKKDLKAVAEKGYALTKGERVQGSFAVAAPLYDEHGKLMASLTLAGPIQRLSEEREIELIRELTHSANDISENFGNFNLTS